MKKIEKNISLNKCMVFRNFPAVILLIYYYLDTCQLQIRNSGLIKYGLIIVFILLGLYIREKGDLFDEAAKQSLQKTDSIIVKLVFVLITIIILMTLLVDDVKIIGYLLIISLILLSILRTVFFYIFDKR